MILAKNIALFKSSLEAISSLIQETNIRFKSEGIYIQAVDKTQILLLDFFFPASCFDTYTLEPSFVGINIFELHNILSRAFDSDKLKLELLDNSFEILLSNNIERKFTLSYLDLPEQDFSLPSIDFTAEIVIDAYLLKEIIKDVNLIGSTLIFKIKNNKFIIECEGEKGKIQTTIPKAKLKSKKDIAVKFSLSYLKNITKTIDHNVSIFLKLAEDSPLFIEYFIDNKIKLNFYLSSMLL